MTEPAFAALAAQIAALHDGPGQVAAAGHRDLGPDLWLSTDPDGQGVLSCQPSEAGFLLRLENGDSGAWAGLGLRLDPGVLAGGRYLGLLIGTVGGGTAAFTPTLRTIAEGGHHDSGTPDPVVLAGGRREQLAWLPLDPARLAAARACELNLFFHSDRAEIDIARLEVLLML